MVVLSLLRINVFFALIITALTNRLLLGMGLGEVAGIMFSWMGCQGETALSYIC